MGKVKKMPSLAFASLFKRNKGQNTVKEKRRRSHQINMLEGPLVKKILLFTLPLAGSSILQQLFNSTDVAVVGRFSSSQALAAVGSNAPLINMFVLLFTGLSVGANVLIARYIGQNDRKKVSEAVHTVITLSLICGFLLLILGQVIAAPLLRLMNTPDDVIDLAATYLRIYFMGMPFVMLYNFGSAILRSVGDTSRPLYCLVISGIVNVLLNLFFVIVCDMSVAGVAIATVIADGISAGLVMMFLIRNEDESIRVNPKKLSFKKEHLIMILKIGAPAGIQGMVFSISNVFIQTAINGFGSQAVAGSSAELNFEYITYYIVSAFSQAAVTFTSQNYGALQFDRCKKVFRLCMLFSCIFTGCVSVIFMLGSGFFITFFTTDPTVIKYAIIRMAIVMLLELMTGSYEISGGALRGIGHSLLPAILTIFGSVVFRIIWLFTVFKAYHTYDMLLMVYPVSWLITGTSVLIAYFIIRKREFKKVSAAFEF